MEERKEEAEKPPRRVPCAGGLFGERIRYPGLTHGGREIRELSEDLPKRLAVLAYKRKAQQGWIVFLGGTGTGKSTLFNALCGTALSVTGIERPKTRGPILYAHRDIPIQRDFPFPSVQMERLGQEYHTEPLHGKPGILTVLDHGRKEWSHLVIVDTPDLDSLELENRLVAEDLYLLSDAVVFVTSQEKYADEVPFEFFMRIARDGKPYFLLINKVSGDFTREDALRVLRTPETPLEAEKIRLIQRTPTPTEQIPKDPSFLDFTNSISREFSAKGMGRFKQAQDSLRAEDLRERLNRLASLLEGENRAALGWLSSLETLHNTVSQEFVKGQRERFSARSREYLREEIRRLFSRYDVLAKPRRIVQSVLLIPFRFLRLLPPGPMKSPKEALLQIRKKIDLSPVEAAVEKYNLQVLEKLSPPDPESPLFSHLRKAGVALGKEEIRKRIWEEQDRLIKWLEETFRRLSRDIPTGKKWGIYSTSILWGIILISFETAVGGGFTILDAALDSAVAPFVTKGAMELFAYREIQKIARELAERYQEGLLSVLHEQRDRYKSALTSLLTSREDLKALRKTADNI